MINVYNNYIYNIEKNEFENLKFNVLIELFENSERKNALISLKYIPEKNENIKRYILLKKLGEVENE